MSNFISIPTAEYEKLCKEHTSFLKITSCLIKLLATEVEIRKRAHRFIEIKGLKSEYCSMIKMEVANG